MTESDPSELDFESDYTQTQDLVSVPLESGDVQALTNRVNERLEAARMIFPDQDVLVNRAVTGLLSGHVILAGPPGTGKTTLARILADAFDCSSHLETATADWSTYDVIGGLQPQIKPGAAFSIETIAPWQGHVVRAMLMCAERSQRHDNDPEHHPMQGHWLIIDEFNRAEIDRAIGALYTVLGGGGAESVKLWFEPDPPKSQVWMPGRFRIIGTLNSVDTSYVYSFSQGLTRRFRYVYVGVPTTEQVDEEIQRARAQAVSWLAETYPDTAQGVDVEAGLASNQSALAAFVRSIRYGDGTTPGWPVGSAQIVDLHRQLALHVASTDLHAELDLAVADLVVPQMMDLTADQMNLFATSINDVNLPRAGAALKLLREAQNTSFS